MRKGLGKYLFMGLFLLLFSFSSTAFAEENESDFEIEPQPTPLTTEERSYLIEVSGFTNKQVDNLHPETAREIISQEGKVVASGEVDVQLEKPQGQIVPFGYLYDSDVTMAYVVVKTTDDLSGYKKYFATGGFQWKKQPVNYYVDKFSIGFPSHMGVLFPSSGGNITQHAHQYYLYNTSTGAKTYYTKKTRPVDFDPALGVSGTYDLVSSGSIQSNLRHGGSMSQYFYVRNTKVGERFNVKFQYGHARSVLNIGVSYPSSGISLNANTVNDVIHKVVEVYVK